MKTETINFLKFDDDNEIIFFQDFGWWQGIPSDVNFIVVSTDGDRVIIVGNGYGVQSKHPIGGSYGNGAIHIKKSSLPTDILKWCECNCLSN